MSDPMDGLFQAISIFFQVMFALIPVLFWLGMLIDDWDKSCLQKEKEENLSFSERLLLDKSILQELKELGVKKD